MPPARWAILTIEQTLTATGYIIVITTDVPCHLYMRYTTIDPQIHHVPVLQRGIFMHTDIRICFVAYHDNEQEEAGDTLTHTFIKEPWPHCETRWFYFHGTINAVASPSTSPIFKKHRYYVAPPWGPPITDTYLADTADGYLATWRGFPHSTYPLNWNALTSWVGAWETANTLVNHDYLNTASCYRGVLFFDTSALPGNCLIVSAYVRLNTFGTNSPRGALLCLTPATNVNKPLIAADFHALLDTPTIIASHLMQDMTVPPGMILNLSEEGLTHITKAGITKFATRIDFELDADPCSTAYEGIRYKTQEGTPGSVRPILVVTYKLPL